MMKQAPESMSSKIATLEDLAKMTSYSFMDSLNSDPDGTLNGDDHSPRQVFTGHYVPVKPTPIQNPVYVTHSKTFFHELGFADSMANSKDFVQMFSGDLRFVPAPIRKVGWACGYALSIYGTEYNQQCPFQTGNGYGDGRAISVLEAVIRDRRWEMQLKGGGRTPYCRGADGRAVLRSSIREFLAQEHMYALGVPTSRSLSLYASKTEQVQRPWYSDGSTSTEPNILITEPVAISTRVAPSFIRVGQLELFGRRVINNAHEHAMDELEKIVSHLIDREYSHVIDQNLKIETKVILLAKAFRGRLTSLIADWIRVGYCQGNFNSDNCAAGGFTLDYGPYGFCEMFDPQYQPWTGGGRHFSFLNQPAAAERNFAMFCKALQPLLKTDQRYISELEEIRRGFSEVMQTQLEKMWAAKLGLERYNEALVSELVSLMALTPVDYTIFFRELSLLPDDVGPLKKSFYGELNPSESDLDSPFPNAQVIDSHWSEWLLKWKTCLGINDKIGTNHSGPRSRKTISSQMKQVNPKYILREWHVVSAYKQAADGEYSLLRELQDVIAQPYAEQSEEIEEKYYRLRPPELCDIGGVSHYSCSS
ncbi:protein adenylyltransferase SelO [Methylophaga sp.]|uniref:protein adenylyltransferase SelO n=1 Tax=Methylophaga sp. TaxID=2024840 RepID=UPI003F699E35